MAKELTRDYVITMPGKVLTSRDFQADPELATKPSSLTPKRENNQPTEAELAMINRLAAVPLKAEDLYCMDFAPSTQRIDSYFTRMADSSLANYADCAMRGVPFMDSHKTGGWNEATLPIGRSYFGGVEKDPELKDAKRLVLSAYLLRNHTTPNGVNTDELIRGFEAGINSDLSIGFSKTVGTPEKNYQDKTRYVCSLCGKDYIPYKWDSDEEDCSHYAGQLYEVGDRKLLCYLDVENAILREFSTVWEGSTPGAVVLKAKRAFEMGRMTRSEAYNLETLYNVPLFEHKVFSVEKREEETEHGEILPSEVDITATAGDLNNLTPAPIETGNGENEMATLNELKEAREQGEQYGKRILLAQMLRAFVVSKELDENQTALVHDIERMIGEGEVEKATLRLSELLTDTVSESEQSEERAIVVSEPEIISISLGVTERRKYGELQTENVRLKRELAELTPHAEIGKRYRKQTIEDTVRAAIRANIGFTPEMVQEMLERLEIDHIETLFRQYISIGDEKLSGLDENGNPTFRGGRQTEAPDPNGQFNAARQPTQQPPHPVGTEAYIIGKSRN